MNVAAHFEQGLWQAAAATSSKTDASLKLALPFSVEVLLCVSPSSFATMTTNFKTFMSHNRSRSVGYVCSQCSAHTKSYSVIMDAVWFSSSPESVTRRDDVLTRFPISTVWCHRLPRYCTFLNPASCGRISATMSDAGPAGTSFSSTSSAGSYYRSF